MHTVLSIAERIQKGVIPPQELSDFRMWLGAEYAFVGQKLTDILVKKPALWGELRRQTKSDTSAERAWQATEMGMQETRLRMELKTIEKLIGAVSSALRILENEARNLM